MHGVGGGKPGAAARGEEIPDISQEVTLVVLKLNPGHGGSVWRAGQSWPSSQEDLPWDGLGKVRM